MGVKFFLILCLGAILQDAMGNLSMRNYNPKFRHVNRKYLKAVPSDFADNESGVMEEMFLLDTKTNKLTKTDVVLVSMPMESSSMSLDKEYVDYPKKTYHKHMNSGHHKTHQKPMIAQADTMMGAQPPVVLQLLGWSGNPPPPLVLPQVSPIVSEIPPVMPIMQNVEVPIFVNDGEMNQKKPVESADTVILMVEDDKQDSVQKPVELVIEPQQMVPNSASANQELPVEIVEIKVEEPLVMQVSQEQMQNKQESPEIQKTEEILVETRLPLVEPTVSLPVMNEEVKKQQESTEPLKIEEVLVTPAASLPLMTDTKKPVSEIAQNGEQIEVPSMTISATEEIKEKEQKKPEIENEMKNQEPMSIVVSEVATAEKKPESVSVPEVLQQENIKKPEVVKPADNHKLTLIEKLASTIVEVSTEKLLKRNQILQECKIELEKLKGNAAAANEKNVADESLKPMEQKPVLNRRVDPVVAVTTALVEVTSEKLVLKNKEIQACKKEVEELKQKQAASIVPMMVEKIEMPQEQKKQESTISTSEIPTEEVAVKEQIQKPVESEPKPTAISADSTVTQVKDETINKEAISVEKPSQHQIVEMDSHPLSSTPSTPIRKKRPNHNRPRPNRPRPSQKPTTTTTTEASEEQSSTASVSSTTKSPNSTTASASSTTASASSTSASESSSPSSESSTASSASSSTASTSSTTESPSSSTSASSSSSPSSTDE